MSTKSKLAAALAVVTLATSLALPASEAQAKPKWGHVAAGVFGGVILGAAIANSAYAEPVYDDDYPRCRFVRQYDKFGNYIGKARVCRYDD